jgi:hypothetical protein
MPVGGWVEGVWYCIGFFDANMKMQWGPILKYIGEGQWIDEAEEPVTSLWDPVLQHHVAMDAADAYQPQS